MLTGTFAYIGTTEIALIIGAVVLLFGGAKIPQLAKGMGEGIREFKKSMEGNDDGEKPVPPGPAPEAKSDSGEATATSVTK